MTFRGIGSSHKDFFGVEGVFSGERSQASQDNFIQMETWLGLDKHLSRLS